MIITGITRKALLWAFLVLAAIACAGTATAQAWTQLSPTGGPPAGRYLAASVYDATGNNMIVFGGYDGSSFNDVWVLVNANGIPGDAQTWINITPSSKPAPLARFAHTAVYDAVGNNLIVFGGAANFASYLNDVWVLSNANGSPGGGTTAWINVTPSTGPAPDARYAHTAVYDAGHNKMIVFGGYDGSSFLKDVWVLSNANGSESGGPTAWTNITPSSGPAPPARFAHTAVYDAVGNNLIVFGGTQNLETFFNDVWVLSHANGVGGTPAWTNITPSSGPAPSARELSTAVYAAAGNSLVVFGGSPDNHTILNDVWVLSNANGSSGGGSTAWTQLSFVGSPSARGGHTAVFDTAGNNMVVFGGFDGSSFLNDVWVLSDASGVTNVPVNIDIRPRTAVNTISLSTGTNVSVAILSSVQFDATTQVNQTSLTFGHSGTEAKVISCAARGSDVNGDGYKDLVCQFNGTQAGFVLGDTIGYLKGKTTLGNTINGSDSVNITK